MKNSNPNASFEFMSIRHICIDLNKRDIIVLPLNRFLTVTHMSMAFYINYYLARNYAHTSLLVSRYVSR